MKLLLLPILLLTACSYRVEKEPALPVGGISSFSEAMAILGPKCARCHGDFMGSYETLVPMLPDLTARIQSSAAGVMMPPPGSAPLTAAEKSALLAWIANGAPKEGGGQPVRQPEPPPVAVQPGLHFAYVNQEVFKPKCSRCHSAMMSSYESVLSHLEDIEFRVRSTFDFEKMPPPSRAAPLTEEELNLLIDWIRAGAPEFETID